MQTIQQLPLRNIYFPAASQHTDAPLMLILHGLGDRMESFVDFPEFLHGDRMHYLLLNAPDEYPEDMPFGWKWYDLDGKQEPGLKKSSELLTECLQILERDLRVPAERVVSSGFSQGAVVSLYFALRHDRTLAGVGALSGYFFGAVEELSPAGKRAPVFMAHGRRDPVLPFERSAEDARRLLEAGVAVEWREYEMEHSVSPDELLDLKGWLQERLKL